MPSTMTGLKVHEWNVEFKDGKSMVTTGSHPSMIYHYIHTFWPEKEIKKITMLPISNG